jgi:hypothetical protein
MLVHRLFYTQHLFTGVKSGMPSRLQTELSGVMRQVHASD